MANNRYTRKLRVTNTGHGLSRVDLTIPTKVMERAAITGGDVVEIHVTPSRRIVLVPLRPNWPPECTLTPQCRRAVDHEGDCIVEGELPW